MPDHQIKYLIDAARFLLHQHRDWYSEYGDTSPTPKYFQHYLRLKYTINDLMKQRRAHRQNVRKIFEVYADHVIKNRAN